jgi:voltage-gated potassium channel
MYYRTRKKVHILLHPELGNTHWDRALNAFIIILILLNVIVIMLETVPAIYDSHKEMFHWFDVISVAIFSVEYVLRVWSAPHEEKYSHPIYGRLKYMVSPAAIIDLLAIFPFYLHAVGGFDLRVLRMIRLFRFLRLFRLTAYMKATKLILNVFKTTANQLTLSLLLAVTLIIISSSLVYFSEHLAQPDVFTSIPATLWWSVVTLTTVGYGDMIPVTVLGKCFTSLILIAGIALFALPAGILTAAFLEETRKQKAKSNSSVCPHCKMPLDSEVIEHKH